MNSTISITISDYMSQPKGVDRCLHQPSFDTTIITYEQALSYMKGLGAEPIHFGNINFNASLALGGYIIFLKEAGAAIYSISRGQFYTHPNNNGGIWFSQLPLGILTDEILIQVGKGIYAIMDGNFLFKADSDDEQSNPILITSNLGEYHPAGIPARTVH